MCLVGGVFFRLRCGWYADMLLLWFYVNGCVLDLVCTVNLEFFESSCGCFRGIGWSEGF